MPNSDNVVYQGGSPNKWYRIGFVTCGDSSHQPTEVGISAPMRGSSIGCGGDYFNRASGRLCKVIRLNVEFYNGGKLSDPYAIREIRIYRKAVDDANLSLVIPIPSFGSDDYPSPVVREKPGVYSLYLEIPGDFVAPSVYVDVWSFISDLACLPYPDDIDNPANLQQQCGRFWVYPNDWHLSDKLVVPRLSFEPLDVKFKAGEIRWLEVGVMPLPLYDYDHNLVMPIIPQLCPSIIITTRNNERVAEGNMEVGLRQGAYRSNPYVFKYLLDTTKMLMGTYDYRIRVLLPDGQMLVSDKFSFTIG